MLPRMLLLAVFVGVWGCEAPARRAETPDPGVWHVHPAAPATARTAEPTHDAPARSHDY
jgi:hypothetical protein